MIIAQIARSAGAQFVGLQVFETDEMQDQTVPLCCVAARPCCAEIDTVDVGHQVDPKRRVAQLHNLLWPLKVGRTQAQAAKAEVAKRLHESRRVAGVASHPDIQIAGMAWMTVPSHRIAADDQIVNGAGVQARDKLFEVLGQHRGEQSAIAGAAIRRRPAARAVCGSARNPGRAAADAAGHAGRLFPSGHLTARIMRPLAIRGVQI